MRFVRFVKFGLVLACLCGQAFAAEPKDQEFEDSETKGLAERSFGYSWGPEVSAIPALAEVIRSQEEAALAKQKADWNEAVEEFGELGCITCVARGYSNSWEVVTKTKRFVMVQSESWIYTGGAHGNSLFKALGWDRKGGEDGQGAAFRPVDMFMSETALENTAYGDYCASLLAQKGERMGLDISEMNPFDGCPSVTELVVTPLSSDGVQFDRVQFLAAPYVAGSFAEGPYTFEIPVTPAVLAAVSPEFSEHFILGISKGD